MVAGNSASVALRQNDCNEFVERKVWTSSHPNHGRRKQIQQCRATASGYEQADVAIGYRGTETAYAITVTGIRPIRACHCFGPVSCTELPSESTATVTGMSSTVNS